MKAEHLSNNVNALIQIGADMKSVDLQEVALSAHHYGTGLSHAGIEGVVTEARGEVREKIKELADVAIRYQKVCREMDELLGGAAFEEDEAPEGPFANLDDMTG